jgi:hypothetical protein
MVKRIHAARSCGGPVIEGKGVPVYDAVPIYRLVCLKCGDDWWEAEGAPTWAPRVEEANGCASGMCRDRRTPCDDKAWDECHALHKCDGLCGCSRMT